MKILLLSDTHGYIDDHIKRYINSCDEVWHAGDIGNLSVSDEIKKTRPLRAVYGNVDDKHIRAEFPLDNIFLIEGIKVWITHIGGYPNRYESRVKKRLIEDPPNLFISGHSHILKVQFDKKLNLLHMNPGACGKYGFHKVRTLLRFEVDAGNIKNLEAIELNT